MIRRAAILVAVAVLGTGCPEDRAPRRAEPSPSPSAPTCDRRPGAVPAGFTLRRTRELRQGATVGVREEYRDAEGRLLVYLLGVAGEVGEGLPLVERVALVGGERGTFMGADGNWVLTWRGRPPCDPMSIVGNGFRSRELLALLVDARVVAPRGGAVGSVLEWVAVFDAARTADELDPSTEVLLEAAGRSVAVGPVVCWEGLAMEFGVRRSWMVAAVVAPGPDRLDAVVTRVGREPVFLGRMTALCLH